MWMTCECHVNVMWMSLGGHWVDRGGGTWHPLVSGQVIILCSCIHDTLHTWNHLQKNGNLIYSSCIISHTKRQNLCLNDSMKRSQAIRNYLLTESEIQRKLNIWLYMHSHMGCSHHHACAGPYVSTSRVHPVSTGPFFEATTTYLPIDKLEIDGCK